MKLYEDVGYSDKISTPTGNYSKIFLTTQLMHTIVIHSVNEYHCHTLS